MGRGGDVSLRVTLKAYSLDFVYRNDEHIVIDICGVNVELCGDNNINIFGIHRPPAGNYYEFDNLHFFKAVARIEVMEKVILS